jgi:SHOCT-like domain
MQQQTVPTGPNPHILVHAVRGDLRVAGWDRLELMVKTDGSHLELLSNTDPISLSCDEDVILYLPRSANLQVESIAGDASLQALSGPVTLGPVAGDLTMKDLGPVMLGTVSGDASLRNIGALNAENISGDFALRGGHGICAVDLIGGDASIRDIDGMVAVESVGSDLYVRNIHGAVNVNAGADVALFLEPLPGQTYDITAGDDLILRLSPDSNVKLHLTSGSPDSIRVDFPGVELPEDCRGCEVIIGTPAENMPTMLLTAGDDLLVTSQADSWDSAADFGVGMRDGSEWNIPPFQLPDDFSERINRRVQAAMERAQSHLEAASRRAETAGNRASIKIEAAMRRAEAKARAAEVRARRGQANLHVSTGRWNWDISPHGPVPAAAPVSDDERLAILKMLQEKKISVEEAEKLLAALEGK